MFSMRGETDGAPLLLNFLAEGFQTLDKIGRKGQRSIVPARLDVSPGLGPLAVTDPQG